MANYRLHTITCHADSQGAAVHVPGLISERCDINAELVAELTGSAIRPKHTAINAISPLISGSAYSLATILDIVGTTGLGIDSDSNPGLTVYHALMTDMGQVSGGSSNQTTLVKKGVFVPRRITCQSRGDAVLDFEVYTIQKSTNHPVVVGYSGTLPTLTVAEARWTLGPIDIGGTVFSDYNSIEIDFGLQITPEAVESAIYNKYIGVINQIPRITIAGIDPGWWVAGTSGTIPLNGSAVLHANSNIYLRKRTQDGSHFVANGTSEHIMFTFAGIAAIQSTGGTATSLTDSSIVIQPAEDSSGNAPLIVDTTAAIT